MKITRPYWLAISLTFYAMVCLGQSKQEAKDIESAYPVCANGSYTFENMNGIGLQQDVKSFSDIGFHETNSVWMKFRVSQSSKLEMVLEAKTKNDDLDFVLYKSVNGIDLDPIRYVLSGREVGSHVNIEKCFELMGLSLYSNDLIEQNGCKETNDNFVNSPLLLPDNEYYLLVNNLEGSDGFTISFDLGIDAFAKYINCKVGDIYINLSDEVDIYPNPISKYLTIKIPIDYILKPRYEIRNIAGLLVKKGILDTKLSKLDLENLISGQYILTLEDGFVKIHKTFAKI